MGFWEFLSAWYNVPFLIPLVFVFFLSILQLIGIGLESLDIGGGDADLDIDADVDADIDVDLDVDAEPDLDIDIGDAGGPGVIVSALGFFNVGKVPLMIILITWFASWGVAGLICNRFIGEAIRTVPPLVIISLASALIVSVMCTKYFAALLVRIFPQSDPATNERDLIGKVARVTSGSVTSTFGRAILLTPDGYRLTVSCRIEEGGEIPVKGDEVLLADYDLSTRTFEVAKVDVSNL